jgi:hypothetical protein
MGLLVDGVWQEDVSRTKDGHFIRPTTRFRNFVTADGSPGPSGESGFPAEPGRYHLYISLACPWAHRTLIFRALKKLDDVISVSFTEPLYGKTGWEFGTAPGSTRDTANGKATMAEVYLLADPHYSGRVSVPVLWDKTRRTIVNNESAEIIRMLNSAFNSFTEVKTDYYPARQRSGLSEPQQRCLPRRFRDQPSGLRGSRARRLRHARSARTAAFRAALSRRDANHGSGLATVHDAYSFRLCLFQSLQMQSAPHRRLSQPVELSTRTLSGAADSRDGQYRADQAPLLR